MYIIWFYIIIVLSAIIFSFWASHRVRRTFRDYQNQISPSHITGAQAAKMILSANGLGSIRVEQIPGTLSDQYNPVTKTICLSDAVYNGMSTAAFGVAAHETGYALQHATRYAPVRFRTALVPAANIGSRIATPMIIAGLVLTYLSHFFVFSPTSAWPFCAVYPVPSVNVAGGIRCQQESSPGD